MTPNSLSNLKNKTPEWSFLLCIIFVALIVLVPRLDGFGYFPGKYLWAEDGKVFINESQTLGALAIFKPYQGYLHFYPRIITHISSSIDLVYRPVLMLGGWLFAYILMTYALAKAARFMGFGWFLSVVLICLVSLQPNNGENFFNLTNSQWMLGAALVFFALVETQEAAKQSIFKGALLIPLGLTGPFSIILVPILLLKLYIRKDFSYYKNIYLVVFFCAAIQFAVLLNSGRATTGELSQAPWNWFLTFCQIVLFGANSISVLCAALVFWIIVTYSLKSTLFQGECESECEWKKLLLPSLLLITAGLFILSGLYSHKHNPSAMVSLGGGNRYTWIPYIIIFFTALSVSIGRRIVNLAIIFLSAFICYRSFHSVTSENLQFKSFASYSKFQEVLIPIAPQWPIFPGWHIEGRPKLNTHKLQTRHIAILDTEFSFFGSTPDFSDGTLNIESTSNDPIVIFEKPIFCDGPTDVAVEIYLTRNAEGWLQLFWSENRNFVEVSSLRRWYPSGAVKAQFAFPISGSGLFIRFDPMELLGVAKIQEIKIYCL